MDVPNKANLIRFEGYVLDRARWTVLWRGDSVPLTPKTFDLLLYLLERPGQVISKEQLLAALWPRQVVEESNLTQQVFLLRKALTRHGSSRIVETIPGRGYRVAVPVEIASSQDNDFSARTELPVASSEPFDARSAGNGDSISTTDAPTAEDPAPRSPAAPPTATAPSDAIPSDRPASGRPWRWAAVGLVAVMLTIGGWLYLEDRAPGAPVAVVLGDFQGNEDPGLNQALNDALRIDLGQTPYLTLVPRRQVLETLANMDKPATTPIDAVVGREVCERDSAQVLVQGSIARFGSRYLVALQATACVEDAGGRPGPGNASAPPETLALAKRSVDKPDELPGAIDELAADVRRKLGESRASIRRFDQSLFAVKTGSLDALKAYSEGRRVGGAGDWPACLALFKHAQELDPDFGAVYMDMVTVYFNLQDPVNAHRAAVAAYEHRDRMNERMRWKVIADYNEEVTGDTDKVIEAYRQETMLYPYFGGGFSNLAAAYSNSGQSAEALPLARRGLELDPNSPSYMTLLSVQLHLGAVADARTTAETALGKGIDNADIRHALLNTAYTQGDQKTVAAQLAWARAHPDELVLRLDEISLALAGGEHHRAMSLIDALHGQDSAGLYPAQAEDVLGQTARWLVDTGFRSESIALIDALGRTVTNRDALVARAMGDDPDRAEHDLTADLDARGDMTMWKSWGMPEVRAAIAMARGDVQAAAQTLEGLHRFDTYNFGPALLRGEAYRRLNNPKTAIDEFRNITEHPWADTLAVEYPLAFVQLARAYALADEPAKARAAYERFFALWRNADADVPLLVAARSEYARLQAH